MQPQTYQSNNTSLGGWLIVYMVLIVLSLILTGNNLLPVLNVYGQIDSSVQINFTVDIVIIAVYMVALLVSLALIAMRKRIARPWVIGTMVFGIVASLLDVALATNALQQLQLTVPDSVYSGITPNIVFAAVWIPYFLRSQRVRATLTK